MDKPAKEAKTPTSQEQTLGTTTGTVDFRFHLKKSQLFDKLPYLICLHMGTWHLALKVLSPICGGFRYYPFHVLNLGYKYNSHYYSDIYELTAAYATPPHPYVAMYPLGGIYAHPSMPGSYPFSPYAMPSPNGGADASGNSHTPGNTKVDGNLSDGKEKLPIKMSKGSLGSLNKIPGPDAVKYILNHSSAQDIFCVPQTLHTDAYELGSTVCPIAV
ncbi:hypothetical protein LXL04_000822 [Taraxacum kok-saghyz]